MYLLNELHMSMYFMCASPFNAPLTHGMALGFGVLTVTIIMEGFVQLS